MSRWKAVCAVLVFALAVVAYGSVVLGQERAGRAQRPAGERRFDPGRMQQMMMERTREALGANEEEWKVIGPRLETVMTLQRAASPARGAMGMMFRGRRGRRGEEQAPERPEEATEEQTPLEKASLSLQAALADESTEPTQIQEKLTAYRAAREKVRQELDKAQEELREVLSVRQEGQLVLMGRLD